LWLGISPDLPTYASSVFLCQKASLNLLQPDWRGLVRSLFGQRNRTGFGKAAGDVLQQPLIFNPLTACFPGKDNMDLLTAVGLAGNIVQFVDFTGKLISATHKLYVSEPAANAEIWSWKDLPKISNNWLNE
jgi:hypothetical protein